LYINNASVKAKTTQKVQPINSRYILAAALLIIIMIDTMNSMNDKATGADII
jgi:hypothetical protein